MVATKTLVLDFREITTALLGSGQSGWFTDVSVAYDRDVRWSGTGTGLPDHGIYPGGVPFFRSSLSLVTDMQVPVIPNDDPDLLDGSAGFGITVSLTLTPRHTARGHRTINHSWTVVVTSASPATVRLADLGRAEVLPPEFTSVAAIQQWISQATADQINDPNSPAREAITNAVGAVSDSAIAGQVSSSSSATRAALDSAYTPLAKTAGPLQEINTANINRLPSRVLTADGKRVGSVEVMAVRTQDRLTAYTSGQYTNIHKTGMTTPTLALVQQMSGELQTLFNDAATNGRRVVLSPGDYWASGVLIPRSLHLSTMSTIGTYYPTYDGSPGRWYGRTIIRRPSAALWSGSDTRPAFFIPHANDNTDPFGGTVNHNLHGGSGVWLEGFTCRDDDEDLQNGPQEYAPWLKAGEFFESRLNRLFFVRSLKGPAISMDSVSNSQWDDVQVQRCGSQTRPSVEISTSPNARVTNTADFNRLRIERQPNVALVIGSLDSVSQDRVEYSRFSQLHVESPGPVTGTNEDHYNKQGLVRVGNAKHIDFIAPMLYGSVGGCLSHEFPTDAAHESFGMGITVSGGTILGRSDSENQTSTGVKAYNDALVKLISGTGFRAIGTRFWRYATTGAAVEIGANYGADVRVDSGAHHIFKTQALPLVKDLRVAAKPVITFGPGAGTGATATVIGDMYRGQVTVTTGTSPSANTALFTFSAGNVYGSTIYPICIPVSDKAVGLGIFLRGNPTSWGFQVGNTVAPAANTSYVFNYMVEK